jgi:hypothetical protein
MLKLRTTSICLFALCILGVIATPSLFGQDVSDVEDKDTELARQSMDLAEKKIEDEEKKLREKLVTEETAGLNGLAKILSSVQKPPKPLRSLPIGWPPSLSIAWPLYLILTLLSVVLILVVHEYDANIHKFCRQFGWFEPSATATAMYGPRALFLCMFVAVSWLLVTSFNKDSSAAPQPPGRIDVPSSPGSTSVVSEKKPVDQEQKLRNGINAAIKRHRQNADDRRRWTKYVFKMVLVLGGMTLLFGLVFVSRVQRFRLRPKSCACEICGEPGFIRKDFVVGPREHRESERDDVPTDDKPGDWDAPVAQRRANSQEVMDERERRRRQKERKQIGCINCGYPISEYPVLRGSIWGPPTAGKSTFCCATIFMANNQMVPKEFRVIHKDIGMDSRWKDRLDLYEDKQSLPRDQQTTRTLEPLMLEGWRESLTLDFHFRITLSDTAGELFTGVSSANDSERSRALHQDFFFVVVSPVTHQAGEQPVLASAPTSDLNLLFSQLDDIPKVSKKTIAFIVPKIDCLASLDGKNDRHSRTIDDFYKKLKEIDGEKYYYHDPDRTSYDKPVYLSMIRERSEETLNLLEELWHPNLRGRTERLMEKGYECMWFPVSSINLLEEELHSMDLSKRAIKPYGVLEPLLFAAHSHGVIQLRD